MVVLLTVGALCMLLIQGNWGDGGREVTGSRGSPDSRSHGHDCRKCCLSHSDHWIALESRIPKGSYLRAQTRCLYGQGFLLKITLQGTTSEAQCYHSTGNVTWRGRGKKLHRGSLTLPKLMACTGHTASSCEASQRCSHCYTHLYKTLGFQELLKLPEG